MYKDADKRKYQQRAYKLCTVFVGVPNLLSCCYYWHFYSNIIMRGFHQIFAMLLCGKTWIMMSSSFTQKNFHPTVRILFYVNYNKENTFLETFKLPTLTSNINKTFCSIFIYQDILNDNLND